MTRAEKEFLAAYPEWAKNRGNQGFKDKFEGWMKCWKRRGKLDAETSAKHVTRYNGLQIAEEIRKLDEQEDQDGKQK